MDSWCKLMQAALLLGFGVSVVVGNTTISPEEEEWRKGNIPEILINDTDTGESMTDAATKLTLNQTFYFREFHNKIRRSVVPSAGNMKRLKWDQSLADIVARRATTCQPESDKDEMDNLNVGSAEDEMGQEAMDKWVKEKANYDFATRTCTGPCSRYTRMVWAASDLLGCAIQKCGPTNIVVCGYETKGNKPGEWVYRQGPQCSTCPLPWELCFKGLCVKPEVCSRHKLRCTCSIKKCYNCGVMNKQGGCFCECGEGFDGADCSLRCVNEHPFCTHHPGYNHVRVCAQTTDSSVRDVKCRKMCGRCRALTEEKSSCCDGHTCAPGAALNDKCICIGICPGPKCGSLSTSLHPSLLLGLISSSLSLPTLTAG